MKKLILAALAALFCGLAAPALASNCSPYPYTLSNGTTADANQVMTNFNTILSCANNSLAHNGANTDITSLNSLSTPLSLGQGGTGSTNIFGQNNVWTGSQTLATGTTSLAPLLFGSGGSVLTSPTAGAMEWDGSNLYMTNAGASRQTLAYLGLAGSMTVVNQQTAGTSSGENFNSASGWATLVLNTATLNTISGASLASNQITLPAGTYSITATVPLTNNGGDALVACRLRNVTSGNDLLKTTGAGIRTTSGGLYPVMTGVVALPGTRVLSLQCTTNGTSILVGWNTAVAPIVNDGSPEVYEQISITKLS